MSSKWRNTWKHACFVLSCKHKNMRVSMYSIVVMNSRTHHLSCMFRCMVDQELIELAGKEACTVETL